MFVRLMSLRPRSWWRKKRAVRSVRGTINRDRGQLVARLTATIEPQADLATVGAAADAVSADLKKVLAREDLRCQVNLRVAHRGRRLSRVT